LALGAVGTTYVAGKLAPKKCKKLGGLKGAIIEVLS